jgi:GDP-L-fucose synthase
MKTNDSILVTGARGLVGSAIVRLLKKKGFTNVWDPSRKDADFESQEATDFYFSECKPEYVFHCAAKVGGIADNIREPATFLTANLTIQTNVICAANRFDVSKLLFLSSAACYPDTGSAILSPQDIMRGPLDETKSGYAMAKLCGMQLCKEFRKQFKSDFISVIPNNVYGPGDKSSHVIPDLIRRFYQGRITRSAVTCWGTGSQRREFIFADDLADACIFLMENYSGPDPVNIGANRDWDMMALALLVASVTEYTGPIYWDVSKPEGAKQRLLNCAVMNEFGWLPKTCLLDGLTRTFKHFLTTI